MAIAEGQIGPETKYTMELKEGRVVIGLAYDGKQADAGLSIALEIGQFLDMLKEIIPGEIDYKIIEMLKAAFLK